MDAQLEKVKRFGESAVAVSAADMAEMVLAKELLPAGVSVLDAARFYAQNHQAAAGATGLRAAADEWLQFLEFSKQIGAEALRNRTALMKRICETFGDDLAVCGVDGVALQGWMDGRRAAPVTKQDYAKWLSAFFVFCAGRGWCVLNPAAGLAMPAVVECEPGFLPVPDVKRVLQVVS